jgi:glycosyltransferase involved in cell wall biosynthesis
MSHVLIVVENIAVGDDTRARKQVDTLLHAGHRVSVISPRADVNETYRGRPGLDLHDYRPPPTGGAAWAYAIEYAYSLLMAALLSLRVRLSARIDVVQLCQPPDVYVALGWALRLTGARIVVDQRDLLSELYRERYQDDLGVVPRALRALERLSQRSADHVLVVNQTLADRAADAPGVGPDNVTIVRNGPVLATVRASAADPSLREDHRFLAIWSGVMGRQDRLDLLLDAVAYTVRELGRADCLFAILGDGETSQDVKAYARALGMEQWVRFPGWLDEDTLFRYLATADLGLDASLQREVSPVKAVEYMAFGVPFVAFDLPETRRTGGDAAAYAPPADVRALGDLIDSLLRDDDRRRAMGARAIARVEGSLSWERQEPVYLAAIEGASSVARSLDPAKQP